MRADAASPNRVEDTRSHVCLGEAQSDDARLFLSDLLAEQLQTLAGLDMDADESTAVEYGFSEAVS